MDRDRATMQAQDNPFFEDWTTPFEAPPFDRIRPEHFPPAFEATLARHREAIDAVASGTGEADFASVIEPLERAGRELGRVAMTFFNLSGADTNDALQAIERDMAPRLAKHWSAIMLDGRLFARVDAAFARRDALDLTPEQRRVLERTHLGFVRAGAQLPQDKKDRLAAISERLATLGTTFSQNVLADEKAYALVLEGPEDLKGLPEMLVTAAARAAADRGLEGRHVITLSRSSIEPFLTFSERRDLREQAFKAWIARGEGGGATDNRAIIAEMVALRAERARLLGYETFAHFKLDDAMAKTPDAVSELLEGVWSPARARAGRERDALAEVARAEGAPADIAPWDWRHYAEKVRRARHRLDEAEIKPYFQLERMIEAAFDVATRLFGITFHPRADVPVYHPDVRAWEVRRADGSHLGLFLGDYFARSSKRSGAWMSAFRGQRRLDGDVRPIIVNVMNFSKGDPALLSFDDARTLFHEFGHALHGLLSDVTYPSIAGTSVARDFVELPSQLYEHWLEVPQVLERFAVHHRTGEPIPRDLLDRLLKARNFNQGFATVEYLSSALVDLDLHLLPSADNLDPLAFERETLARIGMPDEIVMRHRTPHFTHVFSGDGYAAGYYSYLWSEVLDADAFKAFEEAGDPFDPDTARRLHDHIYSAGNRQDPADAYTAFRGRMPTVQALLEKRGLAGVDSVSGAEV